MKKVLSISAVFCVVFSITPFSQPSQGSTVVSQPDPWLSVAIPTRPAGMHIEEVMRISLTKWKSVAYVFGESALHSGTSYYRFPFSWKYQTSWTDRAYVFTTEGWKPFVDGDIKNTKPAAQGIHLIFIYGLCMFAVLFLLLKYNYNDSISVIIACLVVLVVTVALGIFFSRYQFGFPAGCIALVMGAYGYFVGKKYQE
jgi:hypothetical protein